MNPSLPTGRGGLAAVTGPDGLIYAIGGYNGGAIGTVEVFDTVTGSWATVELDGCHRMLRTDNTLAQLDDATVASLTAG